ncbi:MAG: hypothetical protein AB8B97_11385 [Granulosicoccus sp.]
MNKIISASKQVHVVIFLIILTLSGCSDSEDSLPIALDDLDDLIGLGESGNSVYGLWETSELTVQEPNSSLVYITTDMRYREFNLQHQGSNCYDEFYEGGYPFTYSGDDGNGIDIYKVEFNDPTAVDYVFYLDPISDTNDVLNLRRTGLEGFRYPRIENISFLDINICE